MHLGDEVFGLAKARGQAFVLLVLHHHFLTNVFVDLVSHDIITHGKNKFFWNGRHGGQGANLFAFPSFADPTFVGKFLHKTHALAFGVGEVVREQQVRTQPNEHGQNQTDHGAQGEANEGADEIVGHVCALKRW